MDDARLNEILLGWGDRNATSRPADNYELELMEQRGLTRNTGTFFVLTENGERAREDARNCAWEFIL